MKLTVASALLLAGHAAAYDIIRASSLNCREDPTTKSDIVKVYNLGEDVDITCQTKGQLVSGTTVWDMTPDGCYVLDYYLQTGYSGIFKPLCSDLTASASASTSQSSSSSKDSGSSTSSRPSGSSAASGPLNGSDGEGDTDEASDKGSSGVSSEDEEGSLLSDENPSDEHSGNINSDLSGNASDDKENDESLSSGANGSAYKGAAAAVLAAVGVTCLIPVF
ncbi:hypothetical protein GGI15_004048 [Coemansia interrupta]|uniref:Uncharacterized protein n=1 Tax=Coemansia interrupta TaxID=1126814 RepID=A0A9W8HCI9_9FUNG|nr:hypothetical protein GGI15_004048 [Coemansia interrupta]